MSYPKSSRPRLSQPRWIRVAPSVHPGSSFLPHVRLTSSAAKRGRQDADGPRFIRLDSEFQTLMAVSGLAASYSSGMRMSVSGPWGAQKSRAALRSSSLGFQVSATDNTPSSNRIRRSPLQLAASGHPSKDTRACSEKLTVSRLPRVEERCRRQVKMTTVLAFDQLRSAHLPADRNGRSAGFAAMTASACSAALGM